MVSIQTQETIKELTNNTLEGKVLLITGGTGSFGQKFTEIALQRNPKAIRIFSRGEFLQSEMTRKFNDDRLRFFIGDIRDRDRLHRASQGVDLIVHAAALKQVPSCEYNPIEAVKTNVGGVINIIDAAIDTGVEKVIAISSDKAVQSLNLYGSTKAVMEKLVVQANSYTGGKKPIFSCVRYGNVTASRGSIADLFTNYVKQGAEKLPITDLRMTRFWMSIEQGVNFVLNCISMMRGGEIFVPKIGSSKVIEMVDKLFGLPTEIVGIRPGEKLHEVLISEDEARHTREFEDYFVIIPEHPFWTEDRYLDETGEKLPEGFTYSSKKET